MLAPRHHLSPTVTVQNKIYLAVSNRMIYLCLVGGLDLADLNDFAFFRTFLERGKNLRLFFNVHVSPISTIVISGYRFDPSLTIFPD